MVKPTLIARIESTFGQQTPSGKRIAGWLLTHTGQIPFETADSIARATGTSGITVGRYLRRLGYRNLDDLRQSLRDTPQIDYKPGALSTASTRQQQKHLPDRYAQSLELELDAITQVYRPAQSEVFQRISQRLANADAVFVLGIQSTRGIANAFSAIWSTSARTSAM